VFDCGDDMVAVTLVNESCLTQWKVTPRRGGPGHFAVHATAKTLQQCKDACLFNPQCGKLVWYPGGPLCYLYTSETTLIHTYPSTFTEYKLVKRCDITPGLYFTVDSRFSLTSSLIISDCCPLDLTILCNSDLLC